MATAKLREFLETLKDGEMFSAAGRSPVLLE